MSGFVRMDRGAFQHPLLTDPKRFHAWFWLVAHACWKPTPYDVAGKIVKLERGQLSASVRQLATSWGWSKSAVSRFLSRLETETMIGTASGTGRLVITICNYDKYNTPEKKGGTRKGAQGGTAAGQQRDIKEQGNKGTSNSNELQPEGVSDQVWSDFVAHRKRKRAHITKTAMGRIRIQAEAAGWTIESALAECVERGWVAFKAEWVEKDEKPTASVKRDPMTPQAWLGHCQRQLDSAMKFKGQYEIDEAQKAVAAAERKLNGGRGGEARPIGDVVKLVASNA